MYIILCTIRMPIEFEFAYIIIEYAYMNIKLKPNNFFSGDI